MTNNTIHNYKYDIDTRLARLEAQITVMQTAGIADAKVLQAALPPLLAQARDFELQVM